MLAELMDKEHLTGRRLAKLAGVSYSMPSAILRNKTRPTAEMLKKLARGLATSNSGEFDQAKFLEYAARLLDPLDLAPVIKDGDITGVTEMARCGGCGAEVYRSAMFCPSCGRSFGESRQN